MADLLNGDPGNMDAHVQETSRAEADLSAEAIRRQQSLAALALQGERIPPDHDAWRTQFGIFANDPLIGQVLEEGRRWRAGEHLLS